MLRNMFLILMALALLVGCVPTTPVTPDPTAIDKGPEPTQLATLPPTPVPDTPTEAVPTQEPQVTETSAPNPFNWVAYTGRDSNIWLIDRFSDEARQITDDALAPGPNTPANSETLTYWGPKWSSDGLYLAFMQEIGEPVDSGFRYSFNLYIYDMNSGDKRISLENQQLAGFDWKPDSHTIAYGLPIEEGYFFNRAEGPDETLSKGIWSLDVDTGETAELVSPEKYALVSPEWSPSGRYLAFEQIYLIEGRGDFGYYDFEEGTFHSFDKPVGGISWSADETKLAYDYLTYAPSGTEKVVVANRDLSDEQVISSPVEGGIAYSPVYSPDGSQLVYLTEEFGVGGPSVNSIHLISAQGGEPRSLGTFDSPQSLVWIPDGSAVLLSTNNFDLSEVREVIVADGSTRILAGGREPAPQGASR